MKHSISQIFNNSSKSQNRSLISLYSNLKTNKNNFSKEKSLNGNYTGLNFPKLYPKLKYISRNNFNNGKSKSIKKIKTALKIIHYPNKNNDNKKLISPKKYDLNNIHYINSTYNKKLIPSLFFKKRTMNDYCKFLNSKYNENNRYIINKINSEFKQKNDNLLNKVENKDGFYIRGIEYRKYYFYPLQEMNLSVFHKKLMKENKERFERRKKLLLKKKINNSEENKNGRRRSISNDNNFIFRPDNRRKTIRYYTKIFYTHKNLENQIKNMIDYEVNNVVIENKLY